MFIENNIRIERGRPKENFLVDCGNGIATVVKVRNGKIIELITILDSNMTEFFKTDAYIFSEKERSGKKVKALIPYYDDIIGMHRFQNKSLAFFVMHFNRIKIQEGYERHHINYFRDNRLASLKIIPKAEHSRNRAYFKTDEDFVNYVAQELFSITTDELEALIYLKLQEACIL